MKITKYLHSCLLVEDQDKTILLDPGNYAFEEKVFPLEQIKQLDAIGITHEHQDHMHLPFLKALLQRFPNTPVFSNESVKDILSKDNIAVETSSNDYLSLQDLPHEKLLSTFPPVAPNVGITLFDTLLHVGDSLKFSSAPKILALPVQAPWGSLVAAAEQGALAQPAYILPIHDYHWKDVARRQFYQWLIPFFKSKNIEFIPMETGETREI